jgi:hypothetical protein
MYFKILVLNNNINKDKLYEIKKKFHLGRYLLSISRTILARLLFRTLMRSYNLIRQYPVGSFVWARHVSYFGNRNMKEKCLEKHLNLRTIK